jgi:uncharacterized membrane protein YoaK (UPF0700 family)
MITPAPDKWLSCALAFVGGYGDAVGFVLAKTFTGHVTGSLVLGAIAITAHDLRGTLTHFLSVVCFLTGILLSGLVVWSLATWPSTQLLSGALGIECVLIVPAYLAFVSHAAVRLESFVVCMSLALGLQNGAFRRTGGVSVHTTYLTGLITGLITTQADAYLFHIPEHPTATNPKLSVLYGIWAAFVLGAGAGAATVFEYGAFAVLGAAVLLLGIIACNAMRALRPAVVN